MNKTLKFGLGAGALAAAAASYMLASGRVETRGASAGTATSGVASAASGAASGAIGGPPVSVTAEKAQKRDFDVQLDATGIVTAVNSVEVKPQVSSVITKVLVREGQFVKTGELLFTLDTRTDDANVAKAQAQLSKDQATLAEAQRQLTRSRELLEQKFVSQAAVDTNLSLVDAQQAMLSADKVAIDAARVGQSYGRITAPGAGRIGTVNVFVGSSVQANTTTLLTITQLDPIYVAFSLPQRNIGDALQSLASGGGRVSATLPESKVVLEGRLQFVDNAVDAATGTVKVKASFENKGQQLWPGQFVNVRMTIRTLKDAVVVPQAAVVQGPRGRVVFVIDPGSKAAARPVELLHSAGAEAVVSGVRAGERVIVDGRQNIRPGSAVVERAVDAGQTGRGGGAASGARTGASSAASEAPGAGATDGAALNAMPKP